MNLFLVSNFGPMFLLCTLQLFFARGFLTQSEHQQNNTWQIVTGQLASLCVQRFVSVFFGNLNVISIDNKHVLTFTFEKQHLAIAQPFQQCRVRRIVHTSWN